jgi:hypothetical protein
LAASSERPEIGRLIWRTALLLSEEGRERNRRCHRAIALMSGVCIPTYWDATELFDDLERNESRGLNLGYPFRLRLPTKCAAVFARSQARAARPRSQLNTVEMRKYFVTAVDKQFLPPLEQVTLRIVLSALPLFS